MSAYQKLNKAADLINAALNELNHTTIPCCECGQRKAENFAHYRAIETMKDMPRKLREQATKLYNDDKERNQDGKKGTGNSDRS